MISVPRRVRSDALLITKPILTIAEGTVLELIALGESSQDIATILYRSKQDVDYHVGNLILKFDARNRTGVVSRAFVLGMLSVSWPPHTVSE
jgi:DNA-binding CsgD family transcriptional regulator